jgi:unsaturated rhamnogalacturonyl hydrolase
MASKVRGEVLNLADSAVQRLRPSRMRWSWGEGLLLYSLLRLDAAIGEPRYRRFVEAYFAHHARRGLPRITWSDQCPPGLAALELHLATGRAEPLATAECVARYIATARPTRAGGLNHFGTSPMARLYPESMWVDSLMMYGVFAARWGAIRNDSAMTRFAIEQPLVFARVLRDADTGLFRHAYFTRLGRAVPIGLAHWLRGNGWVLASLAEILGAVPPACEGRDELVALFRATAAAVARHQRIDGRFATVLGYPSYAENSGTALVAYAMLAGRRDGHLPASFETSGQRAFDALLAHLETRHGRVTMPEISAATMPYPLVGYTLVPRVRDATYGVAAMILAAIARATLEHRACGDVDKNPTNPRDKLEGPRRSR